MLLALSRCWLRHCATVPPGKGWHGSRLLPWCSLLPWGQHWGQKSWLVSFLSLPNLHLSPGDLQLLPQPHGSEATQGQAAEMVTWSARFCLLAPVGALRGGRGMLESTVPVSPL